MRWKKQDFLEREHISKAPKGKLAKEKFEKEGRKSWKEGRMKGKEDRKKEKIRRHEVERMGEMKKDRKKKEWKDGEERKERRKETLYRRKLKG